jgi:tripartite-type tricarboxylate transporter receptor subunit TctC
MRHAQCRLQWTIPLLMLVALAQPAAGAEATADYPSRPIRMIMPQGIGASNDTLARVLTAKLGEVLGQQLVVDNRPGAGGMIGLEIAAHAAPDGYTLLGTATAIQVISPQLYKKLSFDPFRDLAPIALYAITQNALTVHPSLPVRSVKEFIAAAKAAPGKLNMASAGAGAQSHLAGVQFALLTGIDVVHVPYKGGGASVAAVVANESQFTITPLPAVYSFIKSGRLRVLGTGGEKRSPQLPDVPTIAEAGVPGFQSTGWAGLLAPRATPAPILGKIHAALIKVMNQPDTRELIERQGADPVTSTPAEFGRFIREEWDRFGLAIKAAKIKVE